MMISSQEIYHALRAHARATQQLDVDRSRRTDGTDRGAGKSDDVSLSKQAQEFKRLAEAIAELPDVRQERVIPVARAISEGAYRVTDEELAEKILGRSVVDHFED